MFESIKNKISGLFGRNKAKPEPVISDVAGNSGDNPSSKFSDKAITLAIKNGLITEDQASVLLTARDFSEAIVKDGSSKLENGNSDKKKEISREFKILAGLNASESRFFRFIFRKAIKDGDNIIHDTICEYHKDKASRFDEAAEHYTRLAASYEGHAAGYEERAKQLKERAAGIRSTVEWYNTDEGRKFLDKTIDKNRRLFVYAFSSSISKENPEGKAFAPSLGDLMLESGFMGDEAEAAPKISRLFETKASAALEKMQNAVIAADAESVNSVMALYEKPVDQIKVPKGGIGSEKYREVEAKRSLMQAAMHNALYHGDITAEQIKKCVTSEDLALIALQLVIREGFKKDVSSSTLPDAMKVLQDYDVKKLDPASPIGKLTELTAIALGGEDKMESISMNVGAALAEELLKREGAVVTQDKCGPVAQAPAALANEALSVVKTQAAGK